MKLRELTAEQRRILLDASQVYAQFVEVRDQLKVYRGGMHWKKTGSGEYLIRSLDRYGSQQSLGPRSRRTDQTYRDFTRSKQELRSRLKSLGAEVRRQARFCVAAGVNRVPRLAADIVRLLDTNGLLGTHLLVLGSFAIYAYETAAGVQLGAGLLQTEDFDVLFDSGGDLNLLQPIRKLGLIGLLRKADKTFKLPATRSFRAVNAHGFAVELIKPAFGRAAQFSLGAGRDLIAEALPGLDWLTVLPAMTQIVIAENGFPVRFIVPEPRLFALHKLWVSLQPTRSPLKRKRDFRQGEAIARLAVDYLNLAFNDAFIAATPPDLAAIVPGLISRLRSRESPGASRSRLPVGFDEE